MRNALQTAFLLVLLVLLGAGGPAFADGGFRDPTRPYSAPEYSSVVKSHFEVNAIFFSDKRGIAIVNGRRVSVGSEVNGATVLTIRKNAVSLDVDGKEVVLTVRGGAARQ